MDCPCSKVVVPRMVYGAPPMRYRYRAGIEWRVRRGRSQWRAVGEYQHVTWRLSGPGLPDGFRSRWFRDRDRAVAAANAWLTAREYVAPDLAYVSRNLD